MKDKRGIELSFNWLFALIVGAVILFLAIYAAASLLRTSNYAETTIAANQLTILFDPLDTSFSGAKKVTIELPTELTIENKCFSDGVFGRQEFRVKKEKNEKGERAKVFNKYVFSEENLMGKEINFLASEFEMPFPVDTAISMSGEHFCFVSPPNSIEQEITALAPKNVRITNNLANCTRNEMKVCFGQNCDISVFPLCTGLECESDYEDGVVVKNNKRIYYTKGLFYGSVFSPPNIYECVVKRLFLRAQQIAVLYAEEARGLTEFCGSAVESAYLNFANLLRVMNGSAELLNSEVKKAVEDVKTINSGECCLWKC